MIVLYTTEEGGYFKPMELKSPEGKPFFAIVLPSGEIYDTYLDKVDELHKISRDEFKKICKIDRPIIG